MTETGRPVGAAWWHFFVADDPGSGLEANGNAETMLLTLR